MRLTPKIEEIAEVDGAAEVAEEIADGAEAKIEPSPEGIDSKTTNAISAETLSSINIPGLEELVDSPQDAGKIVPDDWTRLNAIIKETRGGPARRRRGTQPEEKPKKMKKKKTTKKKTKQNTTKKITGEKNKQKCGGLPTWTVTTDEKLHAALEDQHTNLACCRINKGVLLVEAAPPSYLISSHLILSYLILS